MSNHDDFWTTFATGHTNTVLAHGMDRHLGVPLGDSFEGVRVLSDVGRAAHALSLPVAAGVKVSFAGTLGALMAHDDSPADGAIGEVVTVKSATGEITHHDGKVFVKWADGKFRPIHAEHLRLAATKGSKKAVQLPRGRENLIGYFYALHDALEKDFNYTAEEIQQMSDSDLKRSVIRLSKGLESTPGGDEAVERAKKNAPAAYKQLARMSGGKLAGMAPASDHRASDKKEVEELLKAKPDNEFLQSVKEQLGEDRSLSDKQEEVLDEIREEVKSDKAASFRVGTLGDLTDFLKIAEGKLIHTSTADLWSYSKDADGAFLVSRLFDDVGDPLKG